ncbi:MAG: hypothetical protein AB7F22_17710 [Reyranella sp.]|uniref:hypothetical protein n=1 Tax=Reyranella sp. TaxID=1929291 RepID=UPI003D1375D2
MTKKAGGEKKPIAGPESIPWMPTSFTIAQAAAVRAVSAGSATPDQQRAAMKFIVEMICGTYDAEFRPGPDGARESAFAGGKRWVGLQIVKLSNTVYRSEPSEQPD